MLPLMGSFDLRAARLDRGLTQRALAARVGVSESTILRAEKGSRPHPPSAEKIASFFRWRVTEVWPDD